MFIAFGDIECPVEVSDTMTHSTRQESSFRIYGRFIESIGAGRRFERGLERKLVDGYWARSIGRWERYRFGRDHHVAIFVSSYKLDDQPKGSTAASHL